MTTAEKNKKKKELEEALAKLPPEPTPEPSEPQDQPLDGIFVQVAYDDQGGLTTDVHVNGSTRPTEIPFLLEVALAQFRARTFGQAPR